MVGSNQDGIIMPKILYDLSSRFSAEIFLNSCGVTEDNSLSIVVSQVRYHAARLANRSSVVTKPQLTATAENGDTSEQTSLINARSRIAAQKKKQDQRFDCVYRIPVEDKLQVLSHFACSLCYSHSSSCSKPMPNLAGAYSTT